MKKLAIFILIAAITMTTGCVKNGAVNVKPNVGSPATSVKTDKDKAPSQGITLNKIKFDKVEEDKAPKAITDKLESLRKNKGFTYVEDKDSGEIYIAVFMGEKLSGGYSIEVVSVEDSDGKTVVEVKEKAPQQGDMVTEVLTYPFVIIKAKGVTPNISVSNTEGEAYKKL